jgi:small subunit ribosomal protein S3
VAQNLKEFQIKEFIETSLSRVGLSDISLQRTPLGDKVIVYASRPGLVVGRGGANIQKLTKDLKEKFNLENPQIEIEEVVNFGLDANIMAEMIVNSLERFGSARFKGIGHRSLGDIMQAGALGVEILISGKVPSSRGKTWRFYQGYLKKCGDVAVSGVNKSIKVAVLKTGAVGVQVAILPPTTKLPDKIILHEATIEEVVDPNEAKEVVEKVAEVENTEAPKTAKKKVAKKAAKKEEKAEEKVEVAPKAEPAKEEAKPAEKPAAKPAPAKEAAPEAKPVPAKEPVAEPAKEEAKPVEKTEAKE